MQKHTREIILSNTLTVFNTVNVSIIALLYAALQFTGDSRLLWDGLGVGISSAVNTVMSILQEYRAHQALEKISVHAKLPASVLRSDGIERIDADLLQPGDVVRVMRGDVVPADGTAIRAVDCQLDTSMLTGESDPLSVCAGNNISGGSFCVSGRLDMQLTADREHTLSGRIESHAHKLDLTPSPLQKNVNAIFVWSFAIAGVFAVVDILRNPSSMLQDVDGIRRAATLVLGLIPESLILLSTITFIIGTIRIRKLGIIVQRLAALESFSQVTDVCFDKTGALTTNELDVDAIIPIGTTSLVSVEDELYTFAWALSDESQIMRALRTRAPSAETPEVVQQTSFSSSTKFSALRFADDNATFVLGAPEVVCTPAHPLWESMHDALATKNMLHHRSVVFARSQGHDNPCGAHRAPLLGGVKRHTTP
ncbi:MAG: HAD-IC family P-type ATPase [Ignavibacteria bacterium]|nr:HAD-IC family P-type ATPase [Ignavibacteria bacterium]